MRIEVHNNIESWAKLKHAVDLTGQQDGYPFQIEFVEAITNGDEPTYVFDVPDPASEQMWDWNITLGFDTAMPLTQVEEFAEELATEARKHIMRKESISVVSVRVVAGPGGIE